MKNIFFLSIFFALILTGCTVVPQIKTNCGDSLCDNLEKAEGYCPQDCDAPAETNKDKIDRISKQLSQVSTKKDSSDAAMVSLGIMVHLEGWFDEVDDLEKFTRHAQAARTLANIFEEHNAKITFEASPEFVDATDIWGDNVLKELSERGHGIGVHADEGGNADKFGLTQEDFSKRLAIQKKNLEEKAGLTIKHVSGTCSKLDWVKATIDAGYEFTTGGVGYCALSLPEPQRPNDFKFCKSPSDCHGVIPQDRKDRIHPWKTSDGSNWLKHDPKGKLTILASDGGTKGLAEMLTGNESGIHEMDYTKTDIEAFNTIFDETLEYATNDQINILYFSLSIGDGQFDQEWYHDWLDAAGVYVDDGKAEWKTMNEMYEEYIS